MDARSRNFSEAPAAVAPRLRFDSFRYYGVVAPEKAFAAAFAIFATALAGCASGLGVNSDDGSQISRVARVEEGTIIAARPVASEGLKSASSAAGLGYTIRLPSGELVSITQPGDLAMPAGTPVLIEYGARARVVPQDVAYGS